MAQGISNPLMVGMGMRTGSVTVGNFGSSHKLDYTIMGGAVNLVARLQSNVRVGKVLVSIETYEVINEDNNNQSITLSSQSDGVEIKIEYTRSRRVEIVVNYHCKE